MRLIWGVSVLLGFGLGAVASAQDAVKLDSYSLFSCSEVKPPQMADSSRKIIVIVIPISAEFNADKARVETLRYELRFPKTVTILDHFPKTLTGTDVAGLTEHHRGEHQISDLNFLFGADGKVSLSLLESGVSAPREKRNLNEVDTRIKSAHLMRRGQVVVVGKTDDGQTLRFDLKCSNQISRAGLTDFAFLAEVSTGWSGDIVTLACTSHQGGAKSANLTKVVGLYSRGDQGARRRVEILLEAALPSVTEAKELITNSIGTKMALIPAGSFLRGATLNDTQSSDHEKPQRKVSITKPFYLGIHEVTQFEYRQLIGDNPSKFKGSESLPVEQVTWFDAIKFCNKLSEREQRRPYYKFEGGKVTILGGNGYRLPTEAEWEYACRAPQSPLTATKHPFGDKDEDLGHYAWFAKNSEWKTHPTGQKKPNRWGLYDMQGNVWEWCQDWYSDTYYNSGPESDPQGPDPTLHRVSRGGGWNFNPKDCRPASRLRDEPGTRFNNLGFRVAADQ